MALVDLTSDLSKFRADFSTPPLADKPYTAKLPTQNSRFDQGTVTIENQLGKGSVFNYVKGGAATNKTFSTSGYSFSRKYSDLIKGGRGQDANSSLLYKKSTETNSPSAIDEQYKKYNLRDDAHNTTYMHQPYILRGIQRKGKETPQYWGFGSRSGFDDGLIRGGVVTVADRIAADTVRIAKWMASPKGLLWVVKQVGLGLSNPNVEKSLGSTLLGIQQTKVHTGLASLLSVPGAPIGLHFTRHGIPFKNETASYENVIKTNQLATLGGSYSRLINLRNALNVTGNTSTGLLNRKGTNIVSLSGITGPQSVYGIGFTGIKRVVDTKTSSVNIALENSNFLHQPNSYLASKRAKTKNPNDSFNGVTFDITAFEEGKSFYKSYSDKLYNSLKAKLTLDSQGFPKNKDEITPFKENLETSETRSGAPTYANAPKTGINSYITLAYNKIPKDSDRKKFRDFRSDIYKNSDIITDVHGGILGTGLDENNTYYQNNNLEGRYGFGDLGASALTKLNPTGPDSFLVKSLDFNRTKNRKVLTETKAFRGDKVTALDISSGTTRLKTEDVYPNGAEDLIKFFFEDGDQGYNVMPFRCTITGLSDSFSPGWDRIDIMGRPDGAYLYSTFERSISFSFIVAALSRSEMIPMWRKLNYLASYTMPDFNAAGAKPSGPFMRITIGDMFQRTPGFIDSLTYTIPDDATWDIADDYNATNNPDPKQLPMVVEASVTFKIIADYRPQMMGRVYSLSPKGSKDKTLAGQWLSDAEVS